MSTTELTSETIHVTGPSFAAVDQHLARHFEQLPGECTFEVGEVVATPGAGVVVELRTERDAEWYDAPADWLWTDEVHPV